MRRFMTGKRARLMAVGFILLSIISTGCAVKETVFLDDSEQIYPCCKGVEFVAPCDGVFMSEGQYFRYMDYEEYWLKYNTCTGLSCPAK